MFKEREADKPMQQKTGQLEQSPARQPQFLLPHPPQRWGIFYTLIPNTIKSHPSRMAFMKT